MKKLLLIVLSIAIVFVSCEKKQDYNEENSQKQSESLSNTFESSQNVTGFAIAYVNDSVIESDLIGIKKGDNEYIDDVASITIGETTIESLFSSGKFNDVYENVQLDAFKNPIVYYIYNGTVYKSLVTKIDVFFDSGMAEFFLKIYSDVPETVSFESADKIPCIISEQQLEIQVLDKNEITDIISIGGVIYTFKENCTAYSESYEVYIGDSQKIFELYFSEP